ncbi:hypothetical protein G7Z17_g1273 [Cylindrodendrum hubeiense]|uniref:Peptidase C14 caspase domain-containing protein n=1 Tax=Cylindrodendrum hubeiense TaxID=595255 RepID=A0A9P5HFA7_9HYPO|nr:hypothetical protein G7Z17_g1273 [Cylindrodendrum hubeiense]
MSFYPNQNYYGPVQRSQQPPFPPQNHNYGNVPPPDHTYRGNPPYYPQQYGYNNQFLQGFSPGPLPGPLPGPPPGPPPHSQFNGYGSPQPPFHAPSRPPPPNLDAYGFPLKQFGSINRSARPGPPPPTAPQQFGNGAPQGYKFQYSNCTGRRKALLIGHGGRTEDLDGDEEDGFDDVIYPVDWQRSGHIVDDEIHWRVVRPLQPGVRLTSIFDSCHSATAMDLPYVYSTKGVLKEPNLAKEAGQGLLGVYAAYLKDDVAGIASSILNFTKSALNGNEGYEKTIQTRTSPADVVMWAGSKDDQTSQVQAHPSSMNIWLTLFFH